MRRKGLNPNLRFKREWLEKKNAYYKFTDDRIEKIDLATLHEKNGDMWIKRLLVYATNQDDVAVYSLNKNFFRS